MEGKVEGMAFFFKFVMLCIYQLDDTTVFYFKIITTNKILVRNLTVTNK